MHLLTYFDARELLTIQGHTDLLTYFHAPELLTIQIFGAKIQILTYFRAPELLTIQNFPAKIQNFKIMTSLPVAHACAGLTELLLLLLIA